MGAIGIAPVRRVKGVQVQAISVRGLWAGLLAVGAVAVAVIGVTGSASAEQAQAAKTAKLKMAIKGDKLDFFGPESVEKGQKLKIVNKTRVTEVGPHTFTLVDPKLVDSAKERKRCERFRSKLCQNILEAHRVGPPPDFPVGKPNVHKGKKGWDKEFTKTKKGDSWFTDQRGASETRRVSADVGDTIGYFCVVHPFMRGKLEVE
jgi:hypothetical protein